MTVIEVFADIGCPFTHVGLRRFVQRRDEAGRTDLVLHVRAWPLEIVNGSPLDAAFIAEEVDSIRAQLGPDSFVGFDPAKFPHSTMAPLALAASASAADLRTGEAVSLRLRDLLFEQGIDVSGRGVLEGLAAEHGLTVDLDDNEPVRAEHRLGVERGVIGSPHFFTPGGNYFCPALEVGRDEHGHLAVTADPEGFDRFFDDCLRLP